MDKSVELKFVNFDWTEIAGQVHYPAERNREIQQPGKVLQTSFSHISINSLTIHTVLMAPKSPWKDLLIDTSYVSKQSMMAEILDRSTGTTIVLFIKSPISQKLPRSKLCFQASEKLSSYCSK